MESIAPLIVLILCDCWSHIACVYVNTILLKFPIISDHSFLQVDREMFARYLWYKREIFIILSIATRGLDHGDINICKILNPILSRL